MEARVLGEREWASVLTTFPGRSIFHTVEWLEAVRSSSGMAIHRLAVFDEESPVLILPLFERRVAGLRSLLSPPPGFGIEFLGPLYQFPYGAKRDKVEIISEETTNLAVGECQNRWKPTLIFLKCSPSLHDVRPWQWLGFEPKPLYTYEIDLAKGLDSVLSSFKRELRNDLTRTAGKVEIEEGGEEAIPGIHGLVGRRFRDQELTFDVPIDYVRSLFVGLGPKRIKAFVAKVRGKPVAGLIATLYNGRATAWIGARAREKIPLPVTDALFWHTMNWGYAQGAQVFELMGANVPRLRAFKAKYNGNLVLFFQLEKSRLVGKVVAKTYRALTSRSMQARSR